ncbi:hypothetical protein SEA_KARDASHIAN_32 [Streptomyces phage Kardashian]|nr:hypothetical protein SEA_KARDASHIAN_32 [Streptomyces phage Kardashian]
MNSEELKIYTLLTHPTAKEDYKITDEGTKLWVMVDGGLVYFEGEGLDKMSPSSLYFFYREKLQEYYTNLWS